MNKREMIHALIDKLLDVEESGTCKELHFTYHSSKISDSLSFHFYEGNGSTEQVLGKNTHAYLTNGLAMNGKSFEQALADIELIKNTPDVEPKVRVTITEEKARELGLIA